MNDLTVFQTMYAKSVAKQLTKMSDADSLKSLSFASHDPLDQLPVVVATTTTTTLALYLHDHKTLQYCKSIR